MKIVKYFILAGLMVILCIAAVANANTFERIFSQEVAYTATQQFNENVNAYSQISINTGVKNFFIFLAYFMGVLGEVLFVRILIRWIRKDIVSKETK